ncbi:hypothetical protein BSNT_10803 [Bacillus subtilis subsp. natto BEST195]|nr:hypothetical protein BSNT_10803 [Bacillus subtilis subsp. natto BEST195]
MHHFFKKFYRFAIQQKQLYSSFTPFVLLKEF